MSQLEHYDLEIYAIEVRIGRLAIACRIDLTDSGQLAAIRNGDSSYFATRDPDACQLLRQMLNLKDYITLHCINDHGADECRQIMEGIEVKLRQNGFRR